MHIFFTITNKIAIFGYVLIEATSKNIPLFFVYIYIVQDSDGRNLCHGLFKESFGIRAFSSVEEIMQTLGPASYL